MSCCALADQSQSQSAKRIFVLSFEGSSLHICILTETLLATDAVGLIPVWYKAPAVVPEPFAESPTATCFIEIILCIPYLKLLHKFAWSAKRRL